MTRVKICGLTTAEDVRAAVDAGADAVGVIVDVTVDTPREVEPSRAADLIDAVAPFVTTVLVTIPESVGRAVELGQALEPDAIQLYGEYSPADLRFLRAETGAKVIPAMDADEREKALELDDAADAVLLDSTEAGAGGTGRTGDWRTTRGLVRDLDSPVVLAGGLTPENVAEAVRTVRPFAVDTASGVEASGGEKDHDAVSRFVHTASDAGRALEREHPAGGDS